MDNSNEIAAERVRHTLTTRGYPAARTGRTATGYGARIIAIAGYMVTPGTPGHGPRVQWDQHLTADELWAKLEQIRVTLGDAGMRAQWVEGEWELEVLEA